MQAEHLRFMPVVYLLAQLGLQRAHNMYGDMLYAEDYYNQQAADYNRYQEELYRDLMESL